MTGLSGGVGALIAKLNTFPIQLISLKLAHATAVESLSYIHRDPFDRMIIATALVEDMVVLTSDDNIHKYDVPTRW